MSIRAKLFLLFLLTVLLLTGLDARALLVFRDGLNSMLKLHESAHVASDEANRLRLQLQLERTAWKNVLLRGGEPGQYHHYLSEFYNLERTTRDQIQALSELLQDDTEIQPLIEQLKQSHLQLGQALRGALRVYNTSAQNAHRFADQVVAELESNPHQLVDQITALVDKQQHTMLATTESRLHREEKLQILSLLLLGGGALLVSFWVLDRNIGKPAEEAAFLANYDALTALPNRTLFRDRLLHAISRAERSGSRVSVLCFDLDHFKAVNDALGHQMGDELLKQVGERLRENLRDSDTPARLGGDEFAVIIENSGEEGSIAHVAQNIVDVIAAPYQIDDHQVHVSASIGITCYPGDGNSLDKLLKNADTAMYLAKQKGRSCYHFYTEDVNQATEQRLMLKSYLHHAVENQGFEPYYQPQLSLKNGSLIGAEALLRFSHEGDSVPPDQFIPVLEETGLINTVGLWVLQTACSTAAGWCAHFGRDIRVAVNLSARQLRDADFTNKVAQILATTCLPSHCLEVEITEHNLIKIKRTGDVLRQLEALGVRLAIDDFGTGYSSLSYLKSFSIDTLKIDSSFIRDITQDDDDDAVTTAIIALSHKLGIEVVAEGVETREQLDFLNKRDCDHIQGFYISCPLPADNFLHWQSNQKSGVLSSSWARINSA